MDRPQKSVHGLNAFLRLAFATRRLQTSFSRLTTASSTSHATLLRLLAACPEPPTLTTPHGKHHNVARAWQCATVSRPTRAIATTATI